MKERAKKLLGVMLAAAMALGVGTTSVTPAAAAEQKAVYAPVAFTNQGWEEPWWEGSQTYICTDYGDEAKAFSDAYTVNFELYVPKPLMTKVLAKEGSALCIGSSVDLHEIIEGSEEWKWLGYVDSPITLEISKDGTRHVVTYWDEAQEKNVDGSAYASVKAKGDYYLVTVKNLPMKSTMYNENDEETSIDTSKAGPVNVTVRVGGVNAKASGFVYLDNLVLKAGGTTVFSQNYNTQDYGWIAYNKNNQPEDTEVKPTSFSTKLLTLSKTSATIKKGKKVTIKATASPSAKITYKSSNKKVATVSAKGVVKGVKAGKATITVTANGVSRTFKVTVKK